MNPIILFDGYCNLCNGAVNFVVRHDRKHQFRYVPLQSPVGKKLAAGFEVPEEVDSVVLIYKGRMSIESDAGINILEILGFPWKIFALFRFVPKNTRDRIYRWIARNRYRWFGRRSYCRVPTAEERILFPETMEL